MIFRKSNLFTLSMCKKDTSTNSGVFSIFISKTMSLIWRENISPNFQLTSQKIHYMGLWKSKGALWYHASDILIPKCISTTYKQYDGMYIYLHNIGIRYIHGSAESLFTIYSVLFSCLVKYPCSNRGFHPCSSSILAFKPYIYLQYYSTSNTTVY